MCFFFDGIKTIGTDRGREVSERRGNKHLDGNNSPTIFLFGPPPQELLSAVRRTSNLGMCFYVLERCVGHVQTTVECRRDD